MKIDYSKCSKEQLKRLVTEGKTPEICTEAWAEYKKSGGGNWEYFAMVGGTPEIRADAKSKIYDISSFLK